MPEQLDKRISMAIDLKKNRLRIHRSTLRLLGFPPFIKLLFSQEHNAVAVISCETSEIRKINEVRVTYDHRDNTHTFDIYSKDLVSVIRLAFKGLDETGLFRLQGYAVPEEHGVYFPLSTLTRSEASHA